VVDGAAVDRSGSPARAARVGIGKRRTVSSLQPMLSIDTQSLAMFATVYGVVAAGAVLLQARQVVRRRSSCEVSARFFATYAGGYAVWLLYGISIDSMPLIVVDAIGLTCGLVTLVVTLAMRGSLARPGTWSSCPGRERSTVEDAGRRPAAAPA
jgi:uncharacterized protein with PQ loop repeat